MHGFLHHASRTRRRIGRAGSPDDTDEEDRNDAIAQTVVLRAGGLEFRGVASTITDFATHGEAGIAGHRGSKKAHRPD